MDKNISALLRQDTKTVGVRFIQDKFKGENYQGMTLLGKDYELSPKCYKYITDLPLEVGDMVVVYAVSVPKLAVVDIVDQELCIEPNDNIEYKWVVCKVDFLAYLENIKKNQQVKQIVHTAYKKNVRRQFNDLLLGGLDEDKKQELLSIIGEKNGTN